MPDYCDIHKQTPLLGTRPPDVEDGMHPDDADNELLCVDCAYELDLAAFESVCLAHRQPIGSCVACYQDETYTPDWDLKLDRLPPDDLTRSVGPRFASAPCFKCGCTWKRQFGLRSDDNPPLHVCGHCQRCGELFPCVHD